MTDKPQSKTLITPRARLSYPHLFEPKAPQGSDEAVYSCCLVFENGKDAKPLYDEALRIAREKWGQKADEAIKQGKIRLPLRDGSEKYAAGSRYLNVKSKSAPGIVDRYAGPDGKPIPISDPELLYPGCYVRASIRGFAYDVSGNRGVSFALGNIQKLDEGERLDGKTPAAEEFEALESGPANLAETNDDDIPF